MKYSKNNIFIKLKVIIGFSNMFMHSCLAYFMLCLLLLVRNYLHTKLYLETVLEKKQTQPAPLSPFSSPPRATRFPSLPSFLSDDRALPLLSLTTRPRSPAPFLLHRIVPNPDSGPHGNANPDLPGIPCWLTHQAPIKLQTLLASSYFLSTCFREALAAIEVVLDLRKHRKKGHRRHCRFSLLSGCCKPQAELRDVLAEPLNLTFPLFARLVFR